MLRISKETMMLIGICILDLVSTLYFMSCGAAYEANPLMAQVLSFGTIAFVIVKLLSVVPYVVLIEIYRVSEPLKARTITKGVCIVYLLIYVYVTVSANFYG